MNDAQFLEQQLDHLEAQQDVTARGGWEGAEDLLKKLASIIAILKGLLDELPKGKITFWWILGNAGTIAGAILALISAIAAEAAKASSAKDMVAALNAAVKNLEDQKPNAPEQVSKWLEVVVSVALIIIEFIKTTDFKGKIDFFFVLRNAGKIAKLVQDVLQAVKG
jgi:hypothetical protein